MQRRTPAALLAELTAIDVWNEKYLKSRTPERSDEICYRLRNWRRREVLKTLAQISTLPGHTGSETILLVEDEAAVAEVMTCMLKSVGYTVLKASNGADALQLSRDYEGRIDLLLTDVVLCGSLRGPDVKIELCKTRPGIKSLLMTGYGEHLDGWEGKILAKPFDWYTLRARVREALEQPEN